MNQDDIKKYIVCINGGSGVIFQPMDMEYSYILTAKHVLEDVNSEPYNNLVTIQIFNAISHNFEEVKPPFELEHGENYFPHSEDGVDIAIIKLPKIANVENIIIKEDIAIDNRDYCLCGYPSIRRNPIRQSIHHGWFRTDLDVIILTEKENKRREADISKNQDQGELEGSSGGGIVRIQGDYLVLAGIQSRVVSNKENLGRIEFTPIEYFNDIIIEYHAKLTPLLPPYLANFSFLKDQIFNITAGVDDEDISFTRLFLKKKAIEVISSDVTPVFIKEYFKGRLLINDSDLSKLNDELIYITWFEFLTLINIVKEKSCNIEDLKAVFCYLRLIYRKTENDWLETDFLKDCLLSNYDGLKENGTVFIKTNKLPLKQKMKHYRLDRGSIVPRIDSLKNEFENGILNSGVVSISNALSDLREFAFDKYNFIHFEYLKQYMLIENSEDFKSYKKSNEHDLIIKLKDEYGKIFGI